jgi:hypothetical protein
MTWGLAGYVVRLRRLASDCPDPTPRKSDVVTSGPAPITAQPLTPCDLLAERDKLRAKWRKAILRKNSREACSIEREMRALTARILQC